MYAAKVSIYTDIQDDDLSGLFNTDYVLFLCVAYASTLVPLNKLALWPPWLVRVL